MADGGAERPVGLDAAPGPDGAATKPGDGTTDPFSSAAYEALFAYPPGSKTTPDSLPGLWAGIVNGNDLRLQFRPDSVVIAVKCLSVGAAIGVSVKANISPSSIRLTESKRLGDGSDCGFAVTPSETVACGDAVGPCFRLRGTTLEFNGLVLRPTPSRESSRFTKVSD